MFYIFFEGHGMAYPYYPIILLLLFQYVLFFPFYYFISLVKQARILSSGQWRRWTRQQKKADISDYLAWWWCCMGNCRLWLLCIQTLPLTSTHTVVITFQTAFTKRPVTALHIPYSRSPYKLYGFRPFAPHSCLVCWHTDDVSPSVM